MPPWGALGFVRVSVTVMCVCARMFLGECARMDARAMARASRCAISRVIARFPSTIYSEIILTSIKVTIIEKKTRRL